MATIKQIAERCGVSTATVSKALNGYSDIGEKTAQLIQKTAAEMGYFPSSVARALKTNRTNNIGVLFTDRTHSGLTHEYFSAVLESIKTQAEDMGYDITFICRNLGQRPMTYLEHCRYRGCDGIIVASVDFADPMVEQLVGSEMPVVTIDHLFNNSSAIMSDNVDGMMQLTQYICRCGHRKIAFIHGENTAVTQKRLAGFYKACEEFGIEVAEEYVVPAMYHDPEKSEQATRTLLDLPTPPTCILYPDDFSFVGGMNAIEARGLKIPQDISVAGFDGILLSQMMRPKLTTVKQNTNAIGRMAAQKLIQAIEEPKTTFPEQIIVTGELLEGGTVSLI